MIIVLEYRFRERKKKKKEIKIKEKVCVKFTCEKKENCIFIRNFESR